MSPIVQVVGPAPTAEIFVSVERMRLVLADVRRELPKLKNDLSRKWPVRSVSPKLEILEEKSLQPIRTRRARLRRHRGVLRHQASRQIGQHQIGERVGDAIGEELAAHVRRWLKTINKTRMKKSVAR